jgi:hypothetical protein
LTRVLRLPVPPPQEFSVTRLVEIMTMITTVIIGTTTTTDQTHTIEDDPVAITAANLSPENPEVDAQDWLTE